MTFEQLKAEILNKAKRLGVCEAFFDIQNATTKPELVLAANNMYEWALTSGIANQDILAEFSESDLNEGNVYRANSAITNPTETIYLLDGIFTINVSGVKSKVVVMGTATATFNVSSGGYLHVKAINNTGIRVEISGNSSGCGEAFNNASVEIYGHNTAIFRQDMNDASSIFASADDSSYIFIKGQQSANGTYNVLTHDAEVQVRVFDKAHITETTSGI